ncbi:MULTISPECIES: DUF551 domain-containing protein [Enterobacter cloacae complex]|uniref:DUF551 domain-containing protein n=1 Tax=Enterobacter cloacae complex TaxID=354276 RepID=UPI0022375C08|nr:DUF551 domain-containing protein [Enterobacter hormaechei]MCW4761630.1 DUF551 domain-containing protein [Enterobacter hormaechei subsp. xiangfangensis]MCW4799353.1 DUF551 domain-containing protein [Enterobacter hormaechei subsp. xiangfangensis]
MITFTKEQLIASAHARIEFAEMMLAGELEPLKERTWSIELELARIALASLEAEPVAYMYKDNLHADARFSLHTRFGNWSQEDINEYEITEIPLYTAPPAPVSVPDAIHSQGEKSASDDYYELGWNACRAAMLQGADRPQNEPQNIPENIPATQFKPVADLYGLTSPTGGETSFTFDAVEARDFIDGGWSCQEYVELGRFQEAMLQNGNSPAQSDCCPEQNYIAPAQEGDSPVLPDGWVACSERMPGSQEWVIVFAKWDNQQVLCWDDVANRWTDFEDQSYYADMFTHWMPLPAAPQQEADNE